jgi:uncharacterized oligopeptide transporter (OPT) family protein
VGIIPALAKIGEELDWWHLILWTLALAFFGVFFAVPLRRQTILREKLRFPSGTATAHMIQVLHKKQVAADDANLRHNEESISGLEMKQIQSSSPSRKYKPLEAKFVINEDEEGHEEEFEGEESVPEEGMLEKEVEFSSTLDDHQWKFKWLVLLYSFLASGSYMVLGFFFPVIQNIPIGTWIASLPLISSSSVVSDFLRSTTSWNWNVTPSLGYVGQGMIMGPRTGFSMLFGAFVGWAFLGPLAHQCGWTHGKINDSQTGARGCA